jgi:predicted alpha/beta-hydrolase family hydrolase
VGRVILFAPGAGLPSSSPWMTAWAQRLGALGDVERFDYPYVLEGRKRPDRLPKLVAHHHAHADDARRPGAPLVLAGKSMGSRVGCHVSLEMPVDALVCFGYPLAATGDVQKLRDQVLLDLRTPILFVQGTRDKLCPLALLDDVRRRMTAPSALHVVEGGDHSLRVTKRYDQQAADAAILEAVARFLSSF